MTTTKQNANNKIATQQWAWHWQGGGYNSCYAKNRQEALNKAGKMCDGLDIQIDESTLHVAKPGELDSLNDFYSGSFN